MRSPASTIAWRYVPTGPRRRRNEVNRLALQTIDQVGCCSLTMSAIPDRPPDRGTRAALGEHPLLVRREVDDAVRDRAVEAPVILSLNVNTSSGCLGGRGRDRGYARCASRGDVGVAQVAEGGLRRRSEQVP